MPYMTRMLADVKRYFPRVDVVPGWETRGDPVLTPGGVTCHWTAGPRGTRVRSSLNIVTYGRSDLSGPLCNFYLDRAGIPVAVAAGRANHAGIPDGGTWRGLRGNSSVYGIEAESGGDGDWTDAQKVAYPRLVRALLDGIGRDASWAVGHNEWAPSRKVDIRDWTMDKMRRDIAAVRPGDDMSAQFEADVRADLHVKQQQIDKMAELVAQMHDQLLANRDGALGNDLRKAHGWVRGTLLNMGEHFSLPGDRDRAGKPIDGGGRFYRTLLAALRPAAAPAPPA